jgi:hypothetical protein
MPGGEISISFGVAEAICVILFYVIMLASPRPKDQFTPGRGCGWVRDEHTRTPHNFSTLSPHIKSNNEIIRKSRLDDQLYGKFRLQ